VSLYEYRCRVLRVIDADTLHVQVSLGLDAYQNLTLRLHGLDAPERGTEAGTAATDYVIAWITAHADTDGSLPLATVKDRREKYGRYLGVIGTLNADLLAAGHARPYGGGAR
jgi:micrococcal nuclease